MFSKLKVLDEATEGSSYAIIAFFYCVVRQSNQVVAYASVYMYFDCDGNSINAKNGTCKNLGYINRFL